MGSIVKVKRKRKLFGHFARTQQKGGSRCVEFFFSLNMDGLENSGEGERAAGGTQISDKHH